MKLRKINAGMSLLTTALLLFHAGYLSVQMLMGNRLAGVPLILARMLSMLMLIHAVLSIILMVRTHRGAKKGNAKSYPKLNRETVVQRVSGILLLVLLGVHIAGAINLFQPKILHAIITPLFFAASMAHAAISTGKALVTLGWGNAETIKIVDVIVRSLCQAIGVASLIGFYSFFIAGGAI
jgi:hypothetical protein